MRKLEESFKTLFHGSEAHNRVLQEKLTQQETIVAKLTKALESIANHRHDFNEDIYRLCNYYEGLAAKTLQEIKESAE